MNLSSGVELFEQMMDKFKIPAIALAKGILPSEEETKIEIVKKQIVLTAGTVEIEIDDLHAWVNPDTGFFEINGLWGAAYIHTIRTSSNDVEDLPKWHMTMCSYLQKRLNEGSLYDRYALKESSVIDNLFSLTHMSWQNRQVKKTLRACKLCMSNVNQTLGGRYRDATGYKFSDYVDEFKSHRRTGSIDYNKFKTNPKPNTYNENFKAKAAEYKKDKFSCVRCNDRFITKFLEVHHINRLKYDDRPENWELLCVSCHIYEHRKDNPRMRVGYEANGRLQSFYSSYPRKQTSPLKDEKPN